MIISEIREYPLGLLDQIFSDGEIQYTEDVKERLEETLNLLSEKEKNMVILRYRERKRVKEIGEILNINSGTVSFEVQRAVGKLRHPILKNHIAGNELNLKENCALENYSLSLRVFNTLRRNGIQRLDEIKSVKQLWKLRGIGGESIKEIVEIAAENGITISN